MVKDRAWESLTLGVTVAACTVSVEGETAMWGHRRCAAWSPQEAAVSLGEARRKAHGDLSFRKIALHIGAGLKQAGFKGAVVCVLSVLPRPGVMVLGNTVGSLVPHGSGGAELRLGSRHFSSLNHLRSPVCGFIFVLLLRLYIILGP